jgi:hypothetical protein
MMKGFTRQQKQLGPVLARHAAFPWIRGNITMQQCGEGVSPSKLIRSVCETVSDKEVCTIIYRKSARTTDLRKENEKCKESQTETKTERQTSRIRARKKIGWQMRLRERTRR